MIILFWNIRGFNNPLKQKLVVDRLVRLKIDVCCLLETRVKCNSSLGNIFKGGTLFPIMIILLMAEFSLFGRVLVLWMCCMSLVNKVFFLAIYACNDGVSCRKLWPHLCSMSGQVGDTPWLLGGGFNVTLSLEESYSFDSS
ncbi:reverse transcriptase [Gossypium australe]|uniref:Reverse transcriptase n=1 Tax=Gossypium australe TaxID=47621 RepID=A0A5B6VMK6_9ROSI|nr:reverse transcriptase [Gossypium australe]